MDKPMIHIPTDPTNLSTDCIGIPSHHTRSKKSRSRGRPKGSKSKNKKVNRKRTALQSHSIDSTDTEYTIKTEQSSHPKRKKRKPNKAHRQAFPHATDEDIRKQLALSRKAKNRKSAQESRERRKRQETYLNKILPKGLSLKKLLKSDKLIHSNGEIEDMDYESLPLSAALMRDSELSQMKRILDEMCDNYACEYDQYTHMQQNREEISDELVIEILKEYMNNNESDSDSDLELETDNNNIHSQVIGEIENGVPMQVDSIPESATPNALKATRGRKAKRDNYTRRQRLQTPPTIPTINCSSNDTELPPPVYGMSFETDFSIAPESAVSSYPVPQDSVLNQCHFQSLYSQRGPTQCIIKHEGVMSHFPAMNYNYNSTPSTISTNSTISSQDTVKEEEERERERILMTLVPTTAPSLPCHYPSQHTLAPIQIPSSQAQLQSIVSKIPSSPSHYYIPIMPHTPEQMHFIQPLPLRVPLHSPIIQHSLQQDIIETKRMLIMDRIEDNTSHTTTNNGKSGKSFKSGNSSNNTSNGEREEREIETLNILVQIVQTFIVIICGMKMCLSFADTQQQYLRKVASAVTELRVLVINFMRLRVRGGLTAEIETHIEETYLMRLVSTLREHPLLPTQQTMDVTSHYQAYRQIAMEILQNMKQQSIYYQSQTQMALITKVKTEDSPLQMGLTKSLESISKCQMDCFGDSQMSLISSTHLRSELCLISNDIDRSLQDKCFKILSSKIK